MSKHDELVKALQWCAKPIPCSKTECPRKNTADEDCPCHVLQDAANAIEGLEAEVKRLAECNDELREKQTFIDNWGTRWMTSAKDVPDSAYKHGYADGKYEALTLERCIDRLHELGWLQEHDRILSQPHWVRCEDELPIKGEIVIVSDGKHTWDVGQYHCLAFSDDRTKWWWKGHTIKTVKWWMRKKDAVPEPPKEEVYG